MKKYIILLLSGMFAGPLFGSGFSENFSDKDLSPQSWMLTLAEHCQGIDYRKPLDGKLAINGLLAPQPGKKASAALERDACFTDGDIIWSLVLELDPAAAGSGSYTWRLQSDNGETQLGVKVIKDKNQPWVVQGVNGFTCKLLSNQKAVLEQKQCKLEIIRRKADYQLLVNGQCICTANGDTDTIASIQLTVLGNAPAVLKAMELKNIK
ncbi:MAG: hypothetical protein E7047_08060 [Lentisphaerae bacterium]|nr:hypothetical protein [Lentisphaerota bacterium]